MEKLIRPAQWLTAAVGFVLFAGAGLVGRRSLGLSLLIGAITAVLGWLAPPLSAGRHRTPLVKALAQTTGACIGAGIAWWWLPQSARWETLVTLVPIAFLASFGLYSSMK